ncbi:hypothetical protein Baya_12800 [Bagarius yarrelli]|uniref:Uncharacterized protein n=1 Tax=Bagarius yarrelli TaxID=175774 RepID=A0A556V453_BAGYA|nr:hypothetical protein Baya_12800 [Bagarius yarrelli]
MRLEFLRARFLLLLFMAAFFCGASASANVTTELTLTTDFDTYNYASEFNTNKSDTFVDSTTKDPNTPTDTTSSSAGTPTVSGASPSAPSPAPASSGVGTVVCLILLFCFLILLFSCAFKWYVSNGRPPPAEIGRSLAECVRNIWAALGRLRLSSKENDEEHKDEEEMEAGIKTPEDQDTRGSDPQDVSDDDSSDYSNVGGAEWTKKGKEIDGQGNEGEDEMSSVELKDETERMKDDLTVL